MRFWSLLLVSSNTFKKNGCLHFFNDRNIWILIALDVQSLSIQEQLTDQLVVFSVVADMRDLLPIVAN